MKALSIAVIKYGTASVSKQLLPIHGYEPLVRLKA